MVVKPKWSLNRKFSSDIQMLTIFHTGIWILTQL